jgi:2-hydroxychromene-2-carboxylate isomerase
VHLVVYGSFSCPYSFLASLRAERLVEAGKAQVEWRAVVHDPEVPGGGRPLHGELADTIDRELEEIGGLLAPGEPYPARRPARLPDTTAAVAGYAAVCEGGVSEAGTDDRARRLRHDLFAALWEQGLDLGDPGVLEALGCPPAAPGRTMAAWQSQWDATERKVVPMLVLEDGALSRGLGALARLARLVEAGGPEAARVTAAGTAAGREAAG